VEPLSSIKRLLEGEPWSAQQCNTKTKSKTLWGRENQNLASNAPVCLKDLDTADFLIDGLPSGRA
jgi:hypothetical protein